MESTFIRADDPAHTHDLTSCLKMICKLSIRARMFLFSLLFRLMSFPSGDINNFFLYIFLLILSDFLSQYLMTTWSHDELYSVQILFFGFINNSIVIIDLKNPQKLSKIFILSRIVHVICTSI